MADTELLREDEISSGVGADIFFRKKKPGPIVGEGYIVEIYENGVKVDEKEVKHKKDVKEIINQYKAKYNTQRSFLNEVQTHVTYKTKEERGEELTPPSEQEKNIREEKEKNNIQNLRGETAMQSIDQILIKKAGHVHELLQRLINPDTPLKKRATAVEEGNISFLPETPNIEDTNTGNITEESVAKQIATKIVEYFNEKVTESPTEGTDKLSGPAPASTSEETPLPITANKNQERNKISYEIDDLYNDVKAWLADVKKVLKNYERSTNKQFSRKKIIEVVKNIVTSNDPKLIQRETGSIINDNVAKVMQEIMLKETGSPSPGQNTQELGKATETTGGTLTDTINKAAITLQDKVMKAVDLINTDQENSTTNFIKEVGLENIDEIEKLLPDTMNGNKIKQIIEEMNSEIQDENDDENELAIIEIHTSEFWNYVGNLNRTASIEKVFEDWINRKKLSIENALNIWNKIQNDINKAFNRNTTAIYKHLEEPVFTIDVVHSNENRQELLFHAMGYIETVGLKPKRIVTEDVKGSEPVLFINYRKQLDDFLMYDIELPTIITNKTPNKEKSSILAQELEKLNQFITDPNGRLMKVIDYILETQNGKIYINMRGPSKEIITSLELPEPIPQTESFQEEDNY